MLLLKLKSLLKVILFLIFQLLAESENNISLLSEQNRVLKEEIRRLHRSIDRMDIANNLEYLKNVLLKVNIPCLYFVVQIVHSIGISLLMFMNISVV